MSKTMHINLALAKLGINSIISPNQKTPEAMTLEGMYDHVLHVVLRSHAWSFAMCHVKGLASLSKRSNAYGLSYALPIGCLRIVDLREGLESAPVEFSLVGDAICTNITDPLLRYITSENLPFFPADFTSAFITRLAAEAAPLLSQDSSAQNRLMQLYMIELEVAQTNDESADNTIMPDPLENSDLLNARA